MPSQSSAIADVGSSLVNLIQQGFEPGGVGLYSPDIGAETMLPKLALFLYSLNKDPNWENQDPESTDGKQESRLALELHYMLFANSPTAAPADRASNEHQWMEYAMSTLSRNAILRDPALLGSLAGKQYELRITLDPVPLTELTGLWQALQGRPFKLAVCYRVGPVFVQTGEVSSGVPVTSVVMGG